MRVNIEHKSGHIEVFHAILLDVMGRGMWVGHCSGNWGKVCVCVCVCERERVCVRVCVRERERERERMVNNRLCLKRKKSKAKER